MAVQYAGGNASKVTAKLAPGSNKDRVALLPKHRRGVIDPLTGFAVLAKGKPENRLQRVQSAVQWRFALQCHA